jgi:hypothetical protein
MYSVSICTVLHTHVVIDVYGNNLEACCASCCAQMRVQRLNGIWGYFNLYG